MICVFIVEAHVPDRVARQFGMFQAIPADVVYSTAHHRMTLKGNAVINWAVKHQGSIDIWNTCLDHIFQSELINGDGTTPNYLAWYLERTVRFISRVGALHVYLGGLLKTIVDRTQSVLPDVSLLATAGLNQLDHHSLYGFEAFPLEDRRNREMEGRQDPGRRPKRGGRGGRGGGRPPRRRADQVVPPVEVEDENRGEPDNVASNLGDDHDVLVDGGGHFDVPDPPTTVPDPPVIVPETTPHQSIDHAAAHQPSPTIVANPPVIVPDTRLDWCPSFDLGLTPTPQQSTDHATAHQPPPTIVPDPPVIVPDTRLDWCPSFDLGLTPTPQQSTDHATTQQPPAIQLTDRPSHEPVSSPSLDVTSSQSTQSSQLPLTQARDPSPPANPSESNIAAKITHYPLFYEPRRSKRQRKATKCGTAGEKYAKHK